jgi:cbb3-type cytochrome oxidase subunit 3
MTEWLAANGSLLVLLVFFAMFLGFAFWAFAPGNKKRMKDYGHIPLKEASDGE